MIVTSIEARWLRHFAGVEQDGHVVAELSASAVLDEGDDLDESLASLLDSLKKGVSSKLGFGKDKSETKAKEDQPKPKRTTTKEKPKEKKVEEKSTEEKKVENEASSMNQTELQQYIIKLVQDSKIHPPRVKNILNEFGVARCADLSLEDVPKALERINEEVKLKNTKSANDDIPE